MMKRKLVKEKSGVFYFQDGKRIEGLHNRLHGDVTGLHGNVTGLRGDVSGLSGNVTGLRGNVSGLRGNVDECELTKTERDAGIDVEKLVI